MNKFESSLTSQLHADLKTANTEQAKKERFLQYLTLLFSSDPDALELITKLAMGSEKQVLNIPRGEKYVRGRADTLTENIIIEWKKDLSKTGEQAKDQLVDYLKVVWRPDEDYNYILITTDGIEWRRYAPDWSNLPIESKTLDRDFNLREISRFILKEETYTDFPFYLDDLLFVSVSKKPTLELIQADFGDTSRVFINSMRALSCVANDIETAPNLGVAYQQWRRFLSIAYGKFDDSPTMFLIHTYLSVFAKLIAHSVLSQRIATNDDEIKDIITGRAFDVLNVERFVEDDFFHWVEDKRYFQHLKPMFSELRRQLSCYNFLSVNEDILKGVYQELIDLDTRHALGEYYTPDWLCERIINELKLESSSCILDPACGSGSFLRAAIARFRNEYPGLSAEQIADQVVGIDIHPLSVLLAKTTLLLALGQSVAKSPRPITLHVYLANSLLVPRGAADLLGLSFQISVDNKAYSLDLQGLSSPDEFDLLIEFCDNLVHSHKNIIEKAKFKSLIQRNIKLEYSSSLDSQLYDVYLALKQALDSGRDSIWKFILQNSYKPIFLMNKFDYVVGNPPWLTYSSISNSEYQNLLMQLSDTYKVTPERRANFPHLEIAAIFLAHSLNYFLKQSGTIAFVVPRSFLSADQHENFRSGAVTKLKISQIWDLLGVVPLFSVPSCVIFAHQKVGPQKTNDLQLTFKGIVFEGRLARSQMPLSHVRSNIRETNAIWSFVKLQGSKSNSRSAFTTSSNASLSGSNAYEDRFLQGATIVPRNLFFVDFNQQSSANFLDDRIWSIRTSITTDAGAKKPWKGNVLKGRTETQYLFRTAISKNLIPFAIVNPPIVILPIVKQLNSNGKNIFRVITSEKLMELGSKYASSWFSDAENLWEQHKTERNKDANTSLSDYLNWQKKLSDQNPDARYLVIYTSSSTDASATIIDRKSFDLPFIVDHKSYWCEVSSLDEGYYLTSFLNSNYANKAIKDFQSRGLFGPRDIHKTIVKVPFPRYRNTEPAHRELSMMGQISSDKVQSFLDDNPQNDLEPRQLGQLRNKVKTMLNAEYTKIDQLVEQICSKHSYDSVKIKNSKKTEDGLF